MRIFEQIIGALALEVEMFAVQSAEMRLPDEVILSSATHFTEAPYSISVISLPSFGTTEAVPATDSTISLLELTGLTISHLSTYCPSAPRRKGIA